MPICCHATYRVASSALTMTCTSFFSLCITPRAHEYPTATDGVHMFSWDAGDDDEDDAFEGMHGDEVGCDELEGDESEDDEDEGDELDLLATEALDVRSCIRTQPLRPCASSCPITEVCALACYWSTD